MRLAADTAWFSIVTSSESFGVYAFSGYEEVHKPYEFSVELVSKSTNIDIVNLLGTPVCLTIADRSGEKRLVHGLIAEMEQLHTANLFTHYSCIIRPRLYFLDKIKDHRIFQNLSVDQIIQQILKEQGFSDEAFSFKLFFKYPPREYCIQYGETDLHFISRLCEEEGIYFYFEHSEKEHTLCFCDRETGPKISGESDLRFYQGSGHLEDTAVISRLRLRHKINSNASTYKEWNFTQPKLDLHVKEKEPEHEKAPVPAGMNLEIYQYPHLYDLPKPGKRYVNLQLLRQLTFREWIEIESDVSRYLPSYTFSIHEHPRRSVNNDWWVVSVRHEGKQPGVLEHESPDDRGHEYKTSVTAIPALTRFIPAIEHIKRQVIGSQTAIVTGPPGEEIYPDNYGRVKVQFFWDREGQWDDKTTCWIRVAQGWAGGEYGMMAIPRIGHEVIVSFLEGDPDRPIITGRVYNALNMPPYTLPEHKTRMTIKSKTHQGEGYNELRFEDMKGNEQIYIHAQFDQDIIVENDSREWVKGNEHLLVEKDYIENIKGISSSQVEKERIEATAKKRTITVGEDEAHQTGGSYHLKVKKNVFLEGDTIGVVEMHKELTLKAPGGFIRIDGNGITIEGKVVNINTGGSPGTGFPVQAVPARTAAMADSRNAESGHKSESKLTEQPKVERSTTTQQPPLETFGNGFTSTPVPGVGPQTPQDSLPKSMTAATPALSLMGNSPIETEQLKTSDTPAAQEWRKTILDASQENTTCGKLETVNSFVQKNVSVTPESAATPQPPATLLESGQGTSLECANAKYCAMQQAGVPADSMRVVSTDQGAVLLVQDGQQILAAGSDYTPGMPMVRDAATLSPDMKPLLGFDANTLFTYQPQ